MEKKTAIIIAIAAVLGLIITGLTGFLSGPAAEMGPIPSMTIKIKIAELQVPYNATANGHAFSSAYDDGLIFSFISIDSTYTYPYWMSPLGTRNEKIYLCPIAFIVDFIMFFLASLGILFVINQELMKKAKLSKKSHIKKIKPEKVKPEKTSRVLLKIFIILGIVGAALKNYQMYTSGGSLVEINLFASLGLGLLAVALVIHWFRKTIWAEKKKIV